METIQTIANAVIALSVCAGAIIAGIGLTTWRHKLHGRSDYELARRVLLTVYQLRNEIQQIRNLLSPEFFDTQYERLNRKVSELDAALLESEVLWADRLRQPKRKLKDCLVTFRQQMRRRYRSQKGRRELTEQEQEEIDSVLYADEDDVFGRKVEEAVVAFEGALKPYLRK